MRSHLDVSGAPDIPSLAFRRFRGEADYPVMVSILDACNDADRLEYINTVEDIASVFSHLTNCDPYRDMLFAEADGETIAFSRVWWVQENAACRLYKSLGFVHPDWRHKGLGAAMLRYNEGHLREIASTHPAGDKRLRTWATDSEYGALALFAGSGYQAVRYYVGMIRPIDTSLPAAPMPQGLDVRPVEPDHIRPIWEAKEEALRDHGAMSRRQSRTMNDGHKAAPLRLICGKWPGMAIRSPAW